MLIGASVPTVAISTVLPVATIPAHHFDNVASNHARIANGYSGSQSTFLWIYEFYEFFSVSIEPTENIL